MTKPNKTSLLRIVAGTLLPAPLGSFTLWVGMLAADGELPVWKDLAVIPLVALFAFTLVGLQSLVSAVVLEFIANRPARGNRFALLLGAGLGVASTMPLWQANSDYVTLMAIGAIVGTVTAWAMRRIGTKAVEQTS